MRASDWLRMRLAAVSASARSCAAFSRSARISSMNDCLLASSPDMELTMLRHSLRLVARSLDILDWKDSRSALVTVLVLPRLALS